MIASNITQFAKQAQISQQDIKNLVFQRNLRQRKPQCSAQIDQNITKKYYSKQSINDNSQKQQHQCQAEQLRSLDKEKQDLEVINFINNHDQLLEKGFVQQQSTNQEKQAYIQFMGINAKHNRIYNFLNFLYRNVQKYGGIIQATSRNCFKYVLEETKVKLNNFNEINFRILFLIYRKFILPYQFFVKGLLKQNKSIDMDYVKFISLAEYQIQIQNDYSYIANIDMMVIQNFQSDKHTDCSKFNANYLKTTYPDKIIQTRMQHPKVLGFNIGSDIMFNGVAKMTLKDYIQYQSVSDIPEQLSKLRYFKQLKKDFIYFAVNIDVEDKPQIETQIRKLIDNYKMFKYLDESDALSYAEIMIPGCNYPQLYLKVKGAWTGGHQQNIALSAININHGPDQSQWISLQSKYMPILRRQIKKQFGVDIHQAQGLWFQKIEWFIARGYPVKRLIQKKGDLVYSGPGTLHWVRSFGKCLQSAWNIFPKTMNQLKTSLNRQIINQDIKFKYTVIPLKSILIKILNHQYNKQNDFNKQSQRLTRLWMENQQQQLMDEYFYDFQFAQKNLLDIYSFCKNCKSEVFNYYFIQKDKVYCIKCVRQQKKGDKLKIIYNKYSRSDILQLLSQKNKLNIANSNSCLIQSLCQGNMVGQIPNCSIKNKKLSSKFPDNEQFQQTQAKQILQLLSRLYPFFLQESKNLLMNVIKQIYDNKLQLFDPIDNQQNNQQFVKTQQVKRQKSRSRSRSHQKIVNNKNQNQKQDNYKVQKDKMNKDDHSKNKFKDIPKQEYMEQQFMQQSQQYKAYQIYRSQIRKNNNYQVYPYVNIKKNYPTINSYQPKYRYIPKLMQTQRFNCQNYERQYLLKRQIAAIYSQDYERSRYHQNPYSSDKVRSVRYYPVPNYQYYQSDRNINNYEKNSKFQNQKNVTNNDTKHFDHFRSSNLQGNNQKDSSDNYDNRSQNIQIKNYSRSNRSNLDHDQRNTDSRQANNLTNKYGSSYNNSNHFESKKKYQTINFGKPQYDGRRESNYNNYESNKNQYNQKGKTNWSNKNEGDFRQGYKKYSDNRRNQNFKQSQMGEY